MKRIATVLGLSLALAATVAACKKSDDEKPSDKDTYAKVLGFVKDPVALVSIYLPYLEPKPLAGKYAPTRRPDFDRSATFAANGIRHAANNARQKLQAESSSIAAGLAEPFVAVTRACADLPDLEAAGKCKTAVQALDAVLQDVSSKAAAAGLAEAFPRVGAAAINDTAKKEVAPLVQAMGGGKAELGFYATLENSEATAQAVVDGCQSAEEEGTANMRAVEKIDEEVRKVAAVHREMLKAVCARVARADKARADLDSCVQEKEKKKVLSKERDEECRLVCTAGKAAVEEGIPAAAYAKIPELYQKLCVDDAAAKK
ncbi:MAG: hypothetical protein FJ095_15545 [Deltaproteobacteria bacterium]|nr:hypothetical protein [Deltaproteobacteria bacterium]